ncbi:MAG TPA: helix-turn-helix domain-containing protein [Pseudonocardiaceae bacterium]|nr:helix-turn-helix domain-containing protein [Pseudonocardiaceae bacterium]
MPPKSDSAGERSKTHSALAAASRVRILELLRRNGAPSDVPELAARSGLHPNTVRFHLKVLVDAGLAGSRPDPRGGSGRPRLVFTATTPGPVDQHLNGYHLLAEILAGYLATTDRIPLTLAEEAGRAFARRHPLPTGPLDTMSADEAVRRVVAMFAELGFEPELDRDGSQLRLRLHACPFHAVASKHPAVVCGMHLGLLKQTLADLDAPVETIGLEPFVGTHLCIAHLGTVGSSAG